MLTSSSPAYGVNEVTGPEWIGVTSKHRPGPNPTIKYVDTGSDKRQRPLSTPAPAPTPTSPSTPSTPVAHMAPSKVVVYKMPVAQMTGLNARVGKLPVAITAQTPAASRSRLQAATQSVLVNGGLPTAMHIIKPIQLLLDPPYVNEPDFTAALRIPDGSETHPKSALQAFYTANTFECGYHTTITKVCLGSKCFLGPTATENRSPTILCSRHQSRPSLTQLRRSFSFSWIQRS